MNKNDKINSHVYIPKSILNRFAKVDEKNRKIIKYIDCNDIQIKTSTTASFNTQLGYYSKQEEIINSFNLRAIGTQCKDSSKIKCVIRLEKELNNLMDIINENKE